MWSSFDNHYTSKGGIWEEKTFPSDEANDLHPLSFVIFHIIGITRFRGKKLSDIESLNNGIVGISAKL